MSNPNRGNWWKNTEEVEFFRRRLADGQRTKKGALVYLQSGMVRWWVFVKAKYSYVFQNGRFVGDEGFWRARASEPGSVAPREKGDRNLRFHLVTASG